MIMMFKL